MHQDKTKTRQDKTRGGAARQGRVRKEGRVRRGRGKRQVVDRVEAELNFIPALDTSEIHKYKSFFG
jgi:hypothetical protein